MKEIITTLIKKEKFIEWKQNGKLFGYIASENNFFETTDIDGKKIMVQSTSTTFDNLHNIPIFTKPIFTKPNFTDSYITDNNLHNIPIFTKPIFTDSYDKNNDSYGISSELQEIPLYKNKNKVLEIGPGHGLVLDKIIQEYGKDKVYAMQPPNAEYSNYNTSIRNKLGDNFLETSLENYTGDIKFDLILIFKWNIPFVDVDNFINKLYDILTIDGIIYITSVEKERLHLVKGKEELYLGDKFLKKFKIIEFPTIISKDSYIYEYIVMSKY